MGFERRSFKNVGCAGASAHSAPVTPTSELSAAAEVHSNSPQHL